MDWEAEGLLDGLQGDAREARIGLLDALHCDGVTIEELRAAVAQERLVLVPGERALLSPARYTLAEVVERGGLGLEGTELRLRTLGVTVPEDRAVAAFGDEEVEAMKRARAYLENGIGLAEGRGVMRALSAAMSRVAEPMRRLFAESYLRPGDNERDLGLRYAEMTEKLMPLVAADLEYLLRLHLRDYERNDALGMAERASGTLPNAVEVSVAFADIVGFTALGEEIAEVELTDIAERLEALAAEHVRSPARVVKTIGDAVMIVSRRPAALVEAMLGLVAAVSAEEGMPPLRAGIAHGRAVARLGDWYGPTVNLAARLTQRARPGSVLVSNPVRDALGPAEAEPYRFSEAGLKRLKGISEPVPVLRVRRAEPDAG